MSELKPCPFCGSEQPQDSKDDGNVPYEFGMSRSCNSCSATVNHGWNTRPIEDALTARIAELEAEVTKCHELQDSYCDRIAESESTIERLIEAGKRLLDSLCTDPEEDKTDEVMNWKAVVDKVNKESEE